MKSEKWLGIYLTAVLVSACTITGPADTTYPTIFEPLTVSGLDSLQTRLLAINAPHYCGVLDSFGFTGTASCFHQNPGHPLSKSLAIDSAKMALVRNRDFTNVSDTVSLSVRATFTFDSTSWSITFNNQEYQEKSIYGTEIVVQVSADGVYNISNHWYPEIYLPENVVYDLTSAKNRLIGQTLTYSGYAGDPHQLTITGSSLGDFDSPQVIIPYRTAHGIEMRLTWRIGVEYFSPDRPGWYIYVDVMTGETVRSEQLFRT